MINRRLLRRCNSISEQTPQLKSSFGGGADLLSLQNKLKDLGTSFEKLKKVFRNATNSIKIMFKDIFEILGNCTLEKKNLILISCLSPKTRAL